MPADADAVARVHAISWRTAYRRLLSAEYLGGNVDSERREAWHARFREPSQDRVVFVVEDDGQVVGFTSISLTAGSAAGYIENLHVVPEHQGRGFGKELLGAAARWALDRAPGATLSLWVFEDNVAARGFYRALGAIETTRARRPLPDGSHHPAVQCEWHHPSALCAGVAHPLATSDGP